MEHPVQGAWVRGVRGEKVYKQIHKRVSYLHQLARLEEVRVHKKGKPERTSPAVGLLLGTINEIGLD